MLLLIPYGKEQGWTLIILCIENMLICLCKFVDIAERNKLDTFEDRVFTYCEARETDTSCLLMHEELWKVFSELKNLWKLAKTKSPPPYPVREPELKVLVYTELKKR